MTLSSPYSKTLQVESGSISISRENILKSLQVPFDKADSYLLHLIDRYQNKSLEISKPCASYTVLKNPQINHENSSLTIHDTTFSLGKIVTHAIKKSTHVAFFICTCGEKVERLSKELIKEGHALEGYIVDLAGSEIAEGMSEIVHEAIGIDVKKMNLNITNRYSPGYCGWPVSDQQFLFPLMKNTCGVSLTPSSLMIPIKSVSGIVGIGPDVRFAGYSCSKCDAAFCIYRDKK